MRIKPGEAFTDTYDGQKIVGYAQPEGSKITLISAKSGGAVTGRALQLIQYISSSVNVVAKLNANYFDNREGSPTKGMALGVRCGLDEWSVPRQSAYYYYAVMKGGRTEVAMDTSFWWTPEECEFACSPALILLKDGKTVNYVSPDAAGSKSAPTTQSMLIRTLDGFIFAACTGKLTPEQCRQWALTIEGVQDLCLMDSGGSTCMEVNGALVVETSRPISNALAFYTDKSVEPVDPQLEPKKTTMKGLDISNWQAGINLSALDFDFVIVKATEGTSFVDKYCDGFVQTAKRLGKCWGFYHFARPTNDAVAEARFFVDNTRNYFGEGIPVLDWEAENKNDTAWALRWLNEVQRLTGVKPIIYMSEYVVNTYDWSRVVAGDYGLWVAKWRDSVPDYNYDMSGAGNPPAVKWWSGYALWQWTSVGRLDGYGGSLDLDVFYGDEKAWKAYAAGRQEESGGGSGSTVQELEKMVSDLTARISVAIAVLKGEDHDQ